MIKQRVVFAIWLVLGAGLSPTLTADTPAPMAAAPRTADEWAAVASQRLKDGERDAAIEALQAAVAADPTNGAAGLLITTLYQAGRIEEAYALGERYHREGPRNPRALFRYGWLLAFIGEVDRAEPLFRDLIALDKGGIYEAWGNGELAYLARARGCARRGGVHGARGRGAARRHDLAGRAGAHDGRGGRCTRGGAAALGGARRQPGGARLWRGAGVLGAGVGAALDGR
ncbi:MAG: tetratricopeptide repeat protein [Gammaproteobacteria bacterium]